MDFKGKCYLIYIVISVVFFFYSFKAETLIIYFNLIKWLIRSSDFGEFVIILDWVSRIFLFVLLIIVGSVGLFSLKYMKGDKLENRFFWILNLFVFSMIVLIISPHFLFFFLGWDGLGFSSFLLIKFYKSSSSWRSRFKTFLINRLGDGLLLGSIGFLLVEGHFFFFFEKVVVFFFFLLILGLVTKRAQFPFSMWLPAAMAAPTPVSSLVHSSTLVTAGIFLIFRLNFLFFKIKKKVLLLLGFVTLFLGRIFAFVRWDRKKVVAFSTLRKLGLMRVSLSAGLIGLSFFHLLMHGVSKALLFVSVGQVMRLNNHSQDLRQFGNIWKTLIFKKISSLWSILSLAGFFFFSVFFSKDYILEATGRFSKIVYVILINFSLFFTYIYRFRLIGFLNKKESYKRCFFFLNENQNNIYIYSNIILFFFTFFLGKYFSIYFIYFFLGEYLFKIVIVILFIFCSVNFMKVSLGSFIKNIKYFKSRFFLGWSFLGVFFNKVLDKGVFLGLKNYLKTIFKKISLGIKTLKKKFFSKKKIKILFLFLIVFLLIFVQK